MLACSLYVFILLCSNRTGFRFILLPVLLSYLLLPLL